MKNYLVLIGLTICSALVLPADTCTQVDFNHCYFGCPDGVSESNILIQRDAYTLSANPETQVIDWVAYTLSPDPSMAEAASTEWKADPCLGFSATGQGSLLPQASFPGVSDVRYDSSRIIQSQGLKDVWQALEASVRDHVRSGHTVYVAAGPLKDKNVESSGYWKIVFEEQTKPHRIRAAAFVFDQDTLANSEPRWHVTSIDTIEAMTGLDFLTQLGQRLEADLERGPADWLFGARAFDPAKMARTPVATQAPAMLQAPVQPRVVAPEPEPALESAAATENEAGEEKKKRNIFSRKKGNEKKSESNQKVLSFQQKDSIWVYVNKLGDTYHRKNCRYLSSSKPVRLGEARKLYDRCKNCSPPK